jgi:hypothetical protein
MVAVVVMVMLVVEVVVQAVVVEHKILEVMVSQDLNVVVVVVMDML